MDTQQKNIAVVTRFLDEVWNQGKAETIDELYDPSGVALGMGEKYKDGPEMFKLFFELMHSTCNDIKVVIKHIMAQDDMVSFYATFDFAHRATGKKLHMEGAGFGKLADGKIVEALNAITFMDVLIQLGNSPADVLPRVLLETK